MTDTEIRQEGKPEKNLESGMRRFGILALIVILPAAGVAQPRSASVKGYGHSIYLSPTNPANDSQLGTVTTYFTTPDFQPGTSLFDQVGNIAYFGGEAKPITVGSTSYYSDYAVFSSLYGFVEVGTARLFIPSADTDGNGVFDFIQFDQGVNRTLSGTADADYDSDGPAPFTGTFIRTAGNRNGAYAITFSSGVIRSGQWSVTSAIGTANYVRGEQNTVRFSVNVDGGEGPIVIVTAATPYTIDSANQITIQPMLVATSSSLLFSQSATTMTRVGNTYRGLLTLIDGNSVTSWADYKQFALEITDNNDSDGDGIPDLSDPIPHPLPALTVTPRNSVVDIRWPNTAFGFVLQSRDSVNTGNWADVGTATTDISGGMKQVTVGAGATTKIFRLAH